MTLQSFVWNHFLVFRRAANIPVAKKLGKDEVYFSLS
jgi:hypothetical protein